MSKALMIRTIHGLMVDPSDERSRDILKGVALGATVQVDVTRPRNLQFHRLFWKLCSTIAEAVPGFQTAENVADVLKISTGHFTTVRGQTDTYRIPKSIGFAAMDEPQFKAFFELCCRVICEGWIKHMKADELRNEVFRMIGVPIEEAA